MPKTIEVPDNAEEVIIRLKKSTATPQKGRGKAKAQKPKTHWQSLTKKQRDTLKLVGMLAFLVVWEIVARGYGDWGILSWLLNMGMNYYGYALDI